MAKYLKMEDLDRDLLQEIIEKIEFTEWQDDQKDPKLSKKILIKYRIVGPLDSGKPTPIVLSRKKRTSVVKPTKVSLR